MEMGYWIGLFICIVALAIGSLVGAHIAREQRKARRTTPPRITVSTITFNEICSKMDSRGMDDQIIWEDASEMALPVELDMGKITLVKEELR